MKRSEARDDLETYLQDHYAGAVGAIELLDHLGEAHRGKPLGEFFQLLHTDVQADHETLHKIMTALEIDESSVRNAGAWIAEKFGRGKLGFGGGETSGIRLLQALESLFLGITGKRLLWRALQAVHEAEPSLAHTDFDSLEKRAVDQLERVQTQRLEAARATFQKI